MEKTLKKLGLSEFNGHSPRPLVMAPQTESEIIQERSDRLPGDAVTGQAANW